MANELAPGEAVAVARALYAEAQAVARFIDEKVRSRVDARLPSVPHGIVFQGQLLRVIAWLRSIAKLQHPADFQAVTAGARAIFEGAVDVTLLHFDPAAHAPEKMSAWEDSSKLKLARSTADYLAAIAREPSEAEQHILTYLEREKPRIDKLRLRFWPNEGGRHPRNRWTGRDLGQDAKQADKHLSEGFEEFYRLRYPELCWNVHGSGVVGLANISARAIPYIGSRAAAEAAQFGRVVAEVVAKHMGCWDEESFKKLREQVNDARVMAYVHAMSGIDSSH